MATKYLDNTGLAYFWGKIKEYLLTNGIPYGTCGTAAGTAAKEATVTGVTKLETGLTIAVKFTKSNTAENPTLNVNSLGAKAIKRYGTTAPSTSAASSWNANSVITLTYDGSYWQMHDWVNTTYSAMSQSEMQTGTATTGRSITAARLKEAVQYHETPNPTKTSDLVNDSGFIAESDVAGYLVKTSLVNIYLSDVSGSDSNDGTSTSKPVKTLDKAFELGLRTGNEFRIRIISNGNYTLSARTVTSICWHIICQDNATNPTVTFGQLCCYNCHLNFAGMDSSNKMTILCSDLATGWYTDNSLCTFQNIDINSHYTQNGGALTMWYCVLHDIRASYASVKMEYTEIGNSLGRVNVIYRHEGGSLVINSGVTINATAGVTYLLDLIGINASIKSGLTGDVSLYTYGVTANGSQVAVTNERLSTYGNRLASNGGFFTPEIALSAELTTLANVGAKNALPYPYYNTTRTVNYVTFTDNGDGTITANGTATASTQFWLRSRTNDSFLLPAGDYIVSDGANGSTSTFYVAVNATVGGSSVNLGNAYTNGGRITVPAEATSLGVYIQINSGKTVSNQKFYPMIRPASITDSTWTFYGMSNAELTKRILALEANIT